MKLGGNLPQGHDALRFLISSTGSFICPVTQTRPDVPRSLITESWTGGGGQSAPAQGRFEPPTCRCTRHQTTMTSPSQKINYTLDPQRGHLLLLVGSSANTAPPRGGHPQGANRKLGLVPLNQQREHSDLVIVYDQIKQRVGGLISE